MTAVVSLETPEVATARQRAEQIRQGIRDLWATLNLIQAAFIARDWEPLGYANWDDYVAAEFAANLLFPRKRDRDEAIGYLSTKMSTRAIAGVLDISQSTAQRVIRAGRPELSQTDSVDRRVSLDGKTRPATRPAPAEPEVAGEGFHPIPVLKVANETADLLRKLLGVLDDAHDLRTRFTLPPEGEDSRSVREIIFADLLRAGVVRALENHADWIRSFANELLTVEPAAFNDGKAAS